MLQLAYYLWHLYDENGQRTLHLDKIPYDVKIKRDSKYEFSRNKIFDCVPTIVFCSLDLKFVAMSSCL